ncbi:MAG: septum formation protein Maf [Acidobacteriota bacterium]|nr:MAG: septum formation protein Maf [Acidobacteriota bacterium]
MVSFILASRSPRRAEILKTLGIPFQTVPAAVDESPKEDEEPEAYARRMALAKAHAVSASTSLGAPGDARYPEALVLGADTVVYMENGTRKNHRRIMGKPASPQEAREMLAALAGKTHRVTTALTFVRRRPPYEACETESTQITFRSLERETIERYVATGEPFDKAGSYGIQGLGGILLVDSLRGSYTNVVGLPVGLFKRMLREAGGNP